MRLGTVRTADGGRVVAADGTGVWWVDPRHGNVLDIIENWAAAQPELGGGAPVDLATVTWRPPVTRPGKVICVALNNSANKDRIMSGPDHPATFIKPSSSLLGHGCAIELDPAWGRVHPEPELAVVIGTTGRHIPVERAYDHVFGYTIINDLTAPIMRGEDTFHYRAIHPDGDGGVRYVDSWVSYSGRYKGSDGFGPIGPWVVTRDEIPDPHALAIRCIHDGRLVTEDNTANLRFHVDAVVAFLSEYMTLEAGDIVAMGTALKASGSGGAVQNVDLTVLGGVIEVEIEGIGTLSNPVRTVAHEVGR
ncbi:MAG TPA: fumarylacetoacetate hydrolase family protein [Ilumatobacter sp.]|nr:fumarylacetoacetate hydrolase family protein [Ilumatobacter sp.]